MYPYASAIARIKKPNAEKLVNSCCSTARTLFTHELGDVLSQDVQLNISYLQLLLSPSLCAHELPNNPLKAWFNIFSRMQSEVYPQERTVNISSVDEIGLKSFWAYTQYMMPDINVNTQEHAVHMRYNFASLGSLPSFEATLIPKIPIDIKTNRITCSIMQPLEYSTGGMSRTKQALCL